ncbi:hypothetical protein CLPUN_33420 [Clostridium puniceum]|uniref:SH3b domain-containing protein n=1 Tax=Clostridium puniceum TaxID=29367 RepID=A0A1S8TCY9_9CLOT|nr:hypothetical protein [Clostridium puniceum]OOM75285.1 hypothetical protein CLPUN_33420 [Clostridium puniceum]
MKKIGIKLLALGILATVITTSTPVFASTNINTTENTVASSTRRLANITGTIASSNVNLRTTPGIETWNVYNVQLKKGDTVLILNEFGPSDGYYWYKVTVTSGILKGKSGYVATTYVDVAV